MNDLPTPAPDFREILDLIASARQLAFQAVMHEHRPNPLHVHLEKD